MIFYSALDFVNNLSESTIITRDHLRKAKPLSVDDRYPSDMAVGTLVELRGTDFNDGAPSLFRVVALAYIQEVGCNIPGCYEAVYFVRPAYAKALLQKFFLGGQGS